MDELQKERVALNLDAALTGLPSLSDDPLSKSNVLAIANDLCEHTGLNYRSLSKGGEGLVTIGNELTSMLKPEVMSKDEGLRDNQIAKALSYGMDRMEKSDLIKGEPALNKYSAMLTMGEMAKGYNTAVDWERVIEKHEASGASITDPLQAKSFEGNLSPLFEPVRDLGVSRVSALSQEDVEAFKESKGSEVESKKAPSVQ